MRPVVLLVFTSLMLAFVAPGVAARSDSKSATRADKIEKRVITLDVVDADVKHVLRLLADTAGKNLVIADTVKGKVSLKLRNVRWDAALRVVLASNDLAAVIEDSIIRVAPRTEIEAETTRRLDRANACEEKAPLVTRMIPVNYASAAEMRPLVEATLTKRGKVTVDERTNVLIVRDVDCP